MSATSPQDDPKRKLRHDIKGCLNSLVLSAEVLGEELERDESVEFLEGMIRAADRMDTLMEQYPYDDHQPPASNPG